MLLVGFTSIFKQATAYIPVKQTDYRLHFSEASNVSLQEPEVRSDDILYLMSLSGSSKVSIILSQKEEVVARPEGCLKF